MFALTIKVLDVLQRVMMVSKIKYDFFFNLDFLSNQTKKNITSYLNRWKEKHKNIEFFSRSKYR